MEFTQDFKNKRVLVMGLGLHGGGTGAAAFFARAGARVTVTDLKSHRELTLSIRALSRFRGIIYHLGAHYPEDFRNADYVIKNPGVRDDSRFLKIAQAAGAAVLSDTEVFFRACPAPIIGITGTKGKSTTTWLIGAFLKGGEKIKSIKKIKKRIWVGGNIRTSMLEFLPRVRREDTVVLELSSFQLDALHSSRMSPRGRASGFSPRIAVITNIFPDHLNRYPSMRVYAASKASIFRFQKRSDFLFVPRGDALLRRLARRAPGRVVFVDAERMLRAFRGVIHPSVPLFHLPNIALAVAVAKHSGVGDNAIRVVLRRFHGVPGRMELVRTVRGVRYINDTTATNPTAALAAVRAVKRGLGKRRLIVLAGGFDKGLPVGEFSRALAHDAAAVIFLPGKASRKMKSQIPNPPPALKFRRAGKSRKTAKSKGPTMFHATTMAEAVRIASRRARPGDVVLLSPGAASFGLFQHEFDRGDQFARAVKALR